MDRPEHGKPDLLIGGKGKPSIANGNTWAESEIKDEPAPDPTAYELAQAERARSAERIQPTVKQRPADEGLFDLGARRQLDLADAVRAATPQVTTMMLLTKADKKKLLANGRTNAVHIADDGNTEDFQPVVKFFDPCGASTWLISELDADEDTMFGLCDLGMACPEMGNVSLAELASVRGSMGIGIERDRWFRAGKTLTEYATEARAAGRIKA